jgi:23S rRNA (uracil1939-C5)-methyltransferase
MKPRHLPPAEQQSLTLIVASLGGQGEGLALHEGRRIYLPGTLPGDQVRAKLTDQLDQNVFRGTVEAIETPSDARVEAPCPYYVPCGGCVLQHMEEDAYQAWKADQVREQLNRAAVEPAAWDEPIFLPQATRRRASFAVMKRGGRLVAGFHGRRSHDIVDIASCLLLHPGLLPVLESARPWLRKLLKDNKAADLFVQEVGGQVEAVLTDPLVLDDLATRETFAAWAKAANLARLSWRAQERDEPEVMIQLRPLLARFGCLTVALPPGAFLQPSREGQTALTKTALAYLQASGHKQGKPIADLFAGCGTFSGPLLDHGPVLAVEVEAAPAKALTAARAGFNLSVEQRNLVARPLHRTELKKFDAVLLDPPRAGAQAQVAEIAASEVAAVVYVSCNPASFAKDAAILRKDGFVLERVRMVDQFIWSTHTELVGLLTRRS